MSRHKEGDLRIKHGEFYYEVMSEESAHVILSLLDQYDISVQRIRPSEDDRAIQTWDLEDEWVESCENDDWKSTVMDSQERHTTAKDAATGDHALQHRLGDPECCGSETLTRVKIMDPNF